MTARQPISPRRWARSSPGAQAGTLPRSLYSIGEVVGVAPASISFDRTGGSLKATVGGILSMESEELVGMDGSNPAVITNPLLGVVPPTGDPSEGRAYPLPRSLGRGVLRDEQLRERRGGGRKRGGGAARPSRAERVSAVAQFLGGYMVA